MRFDRYFNDIIRSRSVVAPTRREAQEEFDARQRQHRRSLGNIG
ncbi:MAG: hypothetical protein WD800_00585 [Dehalococcoidia bacterium]